MFEGDEGRADRAAWPAGEPEWELFQDNRSIWCAVFDQCDAARRSIELEQYIIGTQGVGRRLLDLLAAKARQGVEVRVLADGLGSRGLTRCDGGRALLRAGGRIAILNGPRALLRHPIARAHRLHRKTLITDGAQVMVGGSCYEDRMSSWRDTMIRVGGPLPPAIASEFERAWRDACHEPPETVPGLGGGEAAPAAWSYALGGPFVRARPDLREEIPRRIAGAARSVALTTPYLVPDRRLWRAMISAARRGVGVRILMPARSDHRALDVIGHRFAHALGRRGVEVRGYARGMLHAKVALVDGGWSAVSSFNLDLFSARLNLESGVLSTSPALHAALAARMDADWASSQGI
jgi:cardiolipin synthase